MSTSNQDHPSVAAEEQIFIRKALANVEKAERFQRIKQIVASVLAVLAAFAFAFRPTSPEMRVEATLFIGIGLALAVCTAKITSLINKNTKTVLQAIADMRQR